MVWLAGLLVCVVGPAAWGQQSIVERSSWWAVPVATPRAFLEEAGKHGVSFQYQYVHDLSSNPSPAFTERDWCGRFTWTLSATVDLQKTTGWSGASGYASVKQHVREFGQIDDRVAQGYSNLDTNQHTTLYEAWIQQTIVGGKLAVKAGRIDSNTDFDAVPTAGDFLNSSMGYSPTVMDFPSYPAPQTAVEVLVPLNSATRVAVGEFRTPGGRISLLEGDRTWSGGTDQHGGRAAIGMWNLTESLPRLDGRMVGRTGGLYGVVEQSLGSRSYSDGRKRALTGYLQMGTGDEQVNPYRAHLGGGLVIAAPFRRRAGDAAGIAGSWVHLGPGGCETVVETYYKVNLGRGVSLVQDLQYFRNPGGSGTLRDALVAMPRLVIAF